MSLDIESSPSDSFRVMSFLLHDYLTDAQLQGFNNYKYSSIDSSPVAVYISHPFWNKVVNIYPKWLAPNCLTFGGFMLAMGGFILLTFLDYDFYASSDSVAHVLPIPNWVWLVLSLCTFGAHVLDGTDGKQARRTGSSGPTGELFDHGIDSWLTIPFTLSFFSIFGRADFSISALRMTLVVMSVQLVFITSHWEKYNTGILFLSWGYDVSQYALAILYLVTFLGGYRMYKFAVPLPLGYELRPADVVEFAFYFAGFGVSIPMSLYNLIQSYRSKTGHLRSPYEACLPMFSTGVLFATAIVWAVCSPSDVIDRDPRAFMWLFGTIFSNITCRLIIAQMSNTRAQAWNLLLFPYLALATLTLAFPPLFAPLELTAVAQMCKHFGIYCFSLKKRN